MQKVKFRQVILAVHHHALLGEDLEGDAAFQQKRLLHKNRVTYFRLQLALLILQGRGPVSATEFCLLVQRLDPVFYKASFLRLMSGVVAYLRQTM